MFILFLFFIKKHLFSKEKHKWDLSFWNLILFQANPKKSAESWLFFFVFQLYFCSLRLLISMLLPCWLSSEVSVMRAWTQGPVLKKKVLISYSGTPLELLPARRLSLLRCTRRPCVSSNILERWHALSAGPGSRARGWDRKHAGIMPDLKGEIWFHELPLKREIKERTEETGGIRKEHGFIRAYLGTYWI